MTTKAERLVANRANRPIGHSAALGGREIVRYFYQYSTFLWYKLYNTGPASVLYYR
jgi:hypothetical protein